MKIGLLTFFLSLFLVSYPLHQESSKRKVILVFRAFGIEDDLKVSAKVQKEIKEYCKTKQISLISKEAANDELKKKQGEILSPIYQPGGDLEEKQRKAKEEMVNIPEIARYLIFTFYGAPTTPDSTYLQLFSFPFNNKYQVNFHQTIVHQPATQQVECIKECLDSCLKKGYFE